MKIDSNYYLNGALSGMFGITLSHPIDTIKTHIQTGNKFSTFSINIRNLYKGLTAPLLGVGIEKALVFGTYNYCKKQFDNNNHNNHNHHNHNPSKPNIYTGLSGAIAGLTASLIVTPYERIKILKQNSQKIVISVLTPRFLFKGLSATFTREVPGFAIYFSVYENLKYNTFTKYGKEITYYHAFCYGGLSGIMAWIFIYPQDRIKTILQSNSSTESRNGFSNVMREIYAKGGIKHFYSGFNWAVARAVLLHSGTFCMMEILNKYGNNGNNGNDILF